MKNTSNIIFNFFFFFSLIVSVSLVWSASSFCLTQDDSSTLDQSSEMFLFSSNESYTKALSVALKAVSFSYEFDKEVIDRFLDKLEKEENRDKDIRLKYEVESFLSEHIFTSRTGGVSDFIRQAWKQAELEHRSFFLRLKLFIICVDMSQFIDDRRSLWQGFFIVHYLKECMKILDRFITTGDFARGSLGGKIRFTKFVGGDRTDFVSLFDNIKDVRLKARLFLKDEFYFLNIPDEVLEKDYFERIKEPSYRKKVIPKIFDSILQWTLQCNDGYLPAIWNFGKQPGQVGFTYMAVIGPKGLYRTLGEFTVAISSYASEHKIEVKKGTNPKASNKVTKEDNQDRVLRKKEFNERHKPLFKRVRDAAKTKTVDEALKDEIVLAILEWIEEFNDNKFLSTENINKKDFGVDRKKLIGSMGMFKSLYDLQEHAIKYALTHQRSFKIKEDLTITESNSDLSSQEVLFKLYNWIKENRRFPTYDDFGLDIFSGKVGLYYRTCLNKLNVKQFDEALTQLYHMFEQNSEDSQYLELFDRYLDYDVDSEGNKQNLKVNLKITGQIKGRTTAKITVPFQIQKDPQATLDYVITNYIYPWVLKHKRYPSPKDFKVSKTGGIPFSSAYLFGKQTGLVRGFSEFISLVRKKCELLSAQDGKQISSFTSVALTRIDNSVPNEVWNNPQSLAEYIIKNYIYPWSKEKGYLPGKKDFSSVSKKDTIPFSYYTLFVKRGGKIGPFSEFKKLAIKMCSEMGLSVSSLTYNPGSKVTTGSKSKSGSRSSVKTREKKETTKKDPNEIISNNNNNNNDTNTDDTNKPKSNPDVNTSSNSSSQGVSTKVKPSSLDSDVKKARKKKDPSSVRVVKVKEPVSDKQKLTVLIPTQPQTQPPKSQLPQDQLEPSAQLDQQSLMVDTGSETKKDQKTILQENIINDFLNALQSEPQYMKTHLDDELIAKISSKKLEVLYSKIFVSKKSFITQLLMWAKRQQRPFKTRIKLFILLANSSDFTNKDVASRFQDKFINEYLPEYLSKLQRFIEETDISEDIWEVGEVFTSFITRRDKVGLFYDFEQLFERIPVEIKDRFSFLKHTKVKPKVEYYEVTPWEDFISNDMKTNKRLVQQSFIHNHVLSWMSANPQTRLTQDVFKLNTVSKMYIPFDWKTLSEPNERLGGMVVFDSFSEFVDLSEFMFFFKGLKGYFKEIFNQKTDSDLIKVVKEFIFPFIRSQRSFPDDIQIKDYMSSVTNQSLCAGNSFGQYGFVSSDQIKKITLKSLLVAVSTKQLDLYNIIIRDIMRPLDSDIRTKDLEDRFVLRNYRMNYIRYYLDPWIDFFSKFPDSKDFSNPLLISKGVKPVGEKDALFESLDQLQKYWREYHRSQNQFDLSCKSLMSRVY